MITTIIKVYCINSPIFIKTLIFGLLWRFSLILGYVFSIHAVGITFNAEFQNINEIDFINVLNTRYVIAIILLLFLSASILDVAYSKSRIEIEKTIELFLTKKVRYFGKDFKEITKERKAFCSQILIRCFDVIYAMFLISISLCFIAIISFKLAIILIIITIISGSIIKSQKLKYKKQITNYTSKSLNRKTRATKLIRSAKVRAISTSMAGFFLSILILLIASGHSEKLGLIELAMIAFCIRFFVSFFSLLYVNLNLLADNSKLTDEFNQLI